MLIKVPFFFFLVLRRKAYLYLNEQKKPKPRLTLTICLWFSFCFNKWLPNTSEKVIISRAHHSASKENPQIPLEIALTCQSPLSGQYDPNETLPTSHF